MAELKTKATNASVSAFLKRIDDPQRRQDAVAVTDMMRKVTGQEPKMWGTSIVGFGSYHYKYPSGQEADWPITAFSPRKQDLTLYLTPGYQENVELMEKLGKHRTGVSCLYLKRLSDVHEPTLKKLIRDSVKRLRKLVKERYA